MPSAAPQLELFRPIATDPNVAWLADLLFDRADWVTAATIVFMAGSDYDSDSSVSHPRLNDREVRALAEAAAPKIISGQRGYKHTDHATAEEIKHFIASMESQGSKMLNRANKVRAYAHAKIG